MRSQYDLYQPKDNAEREHVEFKCHWFRYRLLDRYLFSSVFLFVGWSVIFMRQIAWGNLMNDSLVGIVLLAIGIGLLFIGRPNKAGVHPRFLQFEASMVLYPPLVLVFLAGGAAALIAGILGIAH